MHTTLLIAAAVFGVLLIWLLYSFVWVGKQSLLGTWAALLPDGSHVTIQFEGEPKGGTYKQLIKKDGGSLREFGHWTLKLSDLRLIIMASDTKDHPRFGVDTQYWVWFANKDQVRIDGPDRPKWMFRKAPGLPIEFDAPITPA